MIPQKVYHYWIIFLFQFFSFIVTDNKLSASCYPQLLFCVWISSTVYEKSSLHLYTYFLCTVHAILNKITKANNRAFFSHHVLLLWPCVRTARPTLKWCLIVTPTPYWTVHWYFSNILIGCNHLKKYALNMGHKKYFLLPEGNTMQ